MVVSTQTENRKIRPVKVIEREDITVRFCGDSGDGMQLAGTRMTATSAIFGNDVCTLPDFPAEIRAPAGSLGGVSGFQLHFGSHELLTPGDRVNVLIAMNPAALQTNLEDLEHGGVLVVNEDAFTSANLNKAGYDSNPLEDDSLKGYKLYRVPMDQLNADACKDAGLTGRAAGRCKNFFALGLMFWMYGRPMEPTLRWIDDKFAKNPAVADANTKTLKAGFYFGETAEIFPVRYLVAPAKIKPGRYRRVSGNEAMAIGLVAAARRAEKTLVYASYPITPASEILQELAHYKQFGVRTFQAEDEIAAVVSAIGASFAGAFACTGTSGPGLALKMEGIGLAVMAELPLVIIDVQRGGPSTGLPTKTEQGDLNQAIFGRNGETPLCVLAPSTPADCFDIAIEAFRIATEYMTPVIVLSDGYLANGAAPWRIPEADELPSLKIKHPQEGDEYQPYARDEKLSRKWAIPGTPGLEHRIGGLEKKDISGEVCYLPENHERMIRLRREKIDRIAETIPDLTVTGDDPGKLLVLGWGSTYGVITAAVGRCRERGMSVSCSHLRHLEPLPKNLAEVVNRFDRVLVPELNLGQLKHLLRRQCLVDSVGLNKVDGKPFMVAEIEDKIEELLSNGSGS